MPRTGAPEIYKLKESVPLFPFVPQRGPSRIPECGRDAQTNGFTEQNSNYRTTQTFPFLPDLLKFSAGLPISELTRLKRANRPKGWGAKPLAYVPGTRGIGLQGCQASRAADRSGTPGPGGCIRRPASQFPHRFPNAPFPS